MFGTRGWKQMILTIPFIFVFVACAPVVPPTTDHQAAPDTPTTTFTTLPTETPTRTPTQTSPPSQTPLPTWTFLPTLGDFQAEVQLQSWLKGGPECRFPCWAGITPGVTSWQEAKQILGQVVNFEAVYENGRCDFCPCNLIFWRNKADLDIHGAIASQSGSPVYVINLEGHPTTQFIRPDRILTQYGPPDKVFLDTGCYPMEPYDAYFALILGYSEHHFFIKYHMRGILSGDNINGYLIPGEYVYLSIKMIDGEWTEEIIKKALHVDEEIPAWLFRSLEDATDMTVDDLYEIFKDIDGSEYIVAHCRDESP